MKIEKEEKKNLFQQLSLEEIRIYGGCYLDVESSNLSVLS